MANTLRIKRRASGDPGSPSTSQCVNAELAFNEVDGILYYGKGGNATASSSVVAIGAELGTGVAAFLKTPSSANLATALTDETGSSTVVFSNSPTLVTPNIGTPASGTLTNCTGLPISGIASLGTNVGAFLATPSSANLAAAVTEDTGSGALVFSNSPALTTPTFSTSSTGTAGSTQGTNAITTDVLHARAGVTAVTLPVAGNGKRVIVVNKTSTAIAVHPASGESIDGGFANASWSLGANSSMTFLGVTNTLSGITTWIPQYVDIGTGVTNLGTNVSTFLQTPSSANLAAALNDETGTALGSPLVVFSVRPTITNWVKVATSGIATYTQFSESGFSAYNSSNDALRAAITYNPAVSFGYPVGWAINAGTANGGGINFSDTYGGTATPIRWVPASGAMGETAPWTTLSPATLPATYAAHPAGESGYGKITHTLKLPANSGELATTSYVASAIAAATGTSTSLKQAAAVATTANITLAGLQTIDGYTVVDGDRVLVKDQTTGSANGIYVAVAGSWTRTADADTAGEVSGASVFVQNGTTNGSKTFTCTTSNITLGTTALTFAETSSIVFSAGNGLTLTGGTLDIGTASSARIVVSANAIDLATVGTAGTYAKVTTDDYGRVSAGSAQVAIDSDVSGLGTGVATFLATPSSSNLAAALTDETGSSKVVFSTSPTFTTSVATDSLAFGVFDTTATTINAFGAATTGNIGYDGTDNSTTNIATGATANTKTANVNIGNSGAAGSTTNVNIGSAAGTSVVNVYKTLNVGDSNTHGTFNVAAADVGYYFRVFSQSSNYRTQVNTPLYLDTAAGGGNTLISMGNGSPGTPANNHRILVGGITIDSAGATIGVDTYKGAISGCVWQGDAIGATYGGTGQSSYATGDVVYASASNTLSKLTKPASATSVLQMTSAGVPSWNAATGTGSVVFATSPALTTPNIGTPSAGTLTNCTGLPISTGVSGLGTGVAAFLQTPSSANLASALSDETGSSAVVFSTSPAFTTGVNIAGSQTTFDVFNNNAGSPLAINAFAGATTVNVGVVTAAQTINIGTGVTAAPFTRTINIGTNGAASSTTNINIGSSSASGTVTISNDLAATKNLTVSGNLTVNGTTTILNTNTLSVDDKNIEIGAVASTTVTCTVTSGSATVTNLASTKDITVGSAFTASSGFLGVTVPANTTVASINSATQLTLSAALTGSGSSSAATASIGGATDATANLGGITLKGASDKTIIWDSANSNWTSSEHWNIASTNVFKINNVQVLSATALGSNVTGSSLTSVGTISSGTWNGSAVTVGYGGTGLNSAVTGLLKGNGSAYSAATAGTDYVIGGTTTVGKLITQASVTTGASLQITAMTAAPSAPVAGDLWNNAGSLRFYNGAEKTIAFTDSTITGNAANVTGTVAIGNGGTGQTTASAAFNALSPVTTLGDLIYGNGTNTNTRLAGNTSTTRRVLTQTGTGSASAAPVWVDQCNIVSDCTLDGGTF